MNGTTVRIVIKEILFRDAGLCGHIVPDYIDKEIDRLMWEIYPVGSVSIFDTKPSASCVANIAVDQKANTG